MSCVIVLLMAIDMVDVVCRTCPNFSFLPSKGACTPPFICKGARLQGR
jgi:hypothetical protein